MGSMNSLGGQTRSIVLAKFHVNKNRTTPYRIISSAGCAGELIPLGETAMAKFPRTVCEKSAPKRG